MAVEVKVDVECRIQLPKRLPTQFEMQSAMTWPLLRGVQWEVL